MQEALTCAAAPSRCQPHRLPAARTSNLPAMSARAALSHSRYKPICAVGDQMPCRRCGRSFTRVFAHQMLCHSPCADSRAGRTRRLHGTRAVTAAHTELSGCRDWPRCRTATPAHAAAGRCSTARRSTSTTPTTAPDTSASLTRRATGAAPEPRHVRHEAVCDHCGVTYLTRWPEQKFCSVPCVRASRQPREPKPVIAVQLDLRVCPTCGTLHQRPRFCSNECARGAWKIGRRTP